MEYYFKKNIGFGAKKSVVILCEAREKNLWKIYQQIHFYLSADDRVEKKNILDNLAKILRPMTPFWISAKNNLFSHLKKNMVNKKKFGKEAMRYTKNDLDQDEADLDDDLDNDIHKFFKNTNYTIEDIENGINLAIELQEMSLFLLNRLVKSGCIDNEQFDKITKYIDDLSDNKHLNIIVNLLGSAIIFNKKIDMDIIVKKIKKFDTIDEYINDSFGTELIEI